jgi:DNA-binding IclR family transcriptional regulator
MQESFAGKVRQVIMGTPGEFTVNEISERLGIALPKSRKRLHTALRDLRRAGEIERRREGVYALAAMRPSRKPQRREVMWRILRARRAVSVADLQELAGVSRNYAEEWLRMLLRKGVVTRDGGSFRIVSDPVAMPENTEKAAALRDIRKRQAEALALMRRAVDILEGITK